jgi:hypothetical protein
MATQVSGMKKVYSTTITSIDAANTQTSNVGEMVLCSALNFTRSTISPSYNFSYTSSTPNQPASTDAYWITG